MGKVRTMINLIEDIEKKANVLRINIIAVVELGIINYIKELENLWKEDGIK
jgi:hypothetical protein